MPWFIHCASPWIGHAVMDKCEYREKAENDNEQELLGSVQAGARWGHEVAYSLAFQPCAERAVVVIKLSSAKRANEKPSATIALPASDLAVWPPHLLVLRERGRELT